jgi:hypothetical protein
MTCRPSGAWEKEKSGVEAVSFLGPDGPSYWLWRASGPHAKEPAARTRRLNRTDVPLRRSDAQRFGVRGRDPAMVCLSCAREGMRSNA